MNINKYVKSLSAVVLFTTSLAANAAIIASTDFDDRTVAGNTASNLTWVTNGIEDLGDLSADFDLFNTANAQDKFAVDSNIFNESPWTTSLELDVLSGNNISLTELTLDAFIFNNSGNYQPVGRALSLVASVFDESSNLLSSVAVNDIFTTNEAGFSQGASKDVSFDFTGTDLLAGQSYSIELTATGAVYGNNAGFDNLAVNGDVNAVSAPSALAILALGLLGCVAGRFK
jgi:hypothetical protein